MYDLERENGPGNKPEPPQQKEIPNNHHSPNHRGVGDSRILRITDTGSREVSWWAVHEYVTPVLNRVSDWPLVGTPAWDALADDDPRKIAAVFDASQHYALRLDCEQEARIEASHALSAAANWKEQAQRMTARNGAYIVRRSA